MSELSAQSVYQTYTVLKDRLTQPIPKDFVRFQAGGEIIGCVKKTLAMKLAGSTSDFRLTERLALTDENCRSVVARTAAMQKAARILADFGELPDDAGELVDVRATVYDAVFCQAPRLLCRKLGLMTTSIRLTAYDEKGQVILARRRPGKTIGGGLWDSLAAGLVKASEEPEHALYRELYKEAGLTADDVRIRESARFVQELPVPEGYLREVVRNYEAVIKEGVEPINRDGEVSEFAYFDCHEALRMAEQEKLMYAAGVGVAETTMIHMGQRIEEKWLHYKGQVII